MNLTFQCRTAGAGVIYSVLENRSLGEGEYQFNSLQSVHAGEYQCRSSDGEIAASYNITVFPGTFFLLYIRAGGQGGAWLVAHGWYRAFSFSYDNIN